jgi:hypothetical protein
MAARYIHTNLIARDWQRLVAIPGSGTITWTYLRDPEGNIIELQHREADAGAP